MGRERPLLGCKSEPTASFFDSFLQYVQVIHLPFDAAPDYTGVAEIRECAHASYRE
jgi:hypothetical protein